MPVVLINPFAVAGDAEPGFVANWKATAEVFAGEPGYLDTQLHRAVEAESRFRYVNIAHWASAEDWRAAMAKYPPKEKGTAGVEANPALYVPVDGGAVAAHHGSIEGAIRSLEEDLASAYRAADTAWLDRHLADDYVVTDGPGTTSTKAKVLADFRDGRLQVATFGFDEMVVRPVGATAAIVRGQYRWNATYGGHPVPMHVFRYLRIYERTRDAWQIVAGQVTPVQGR